MAPPRREYDPVYLAAKETLPPQIRLEFDLVEERIITDPTRTYQRRYLDDGVIVDASGFDYHGIEVSYLPIGDAFRFIGFTIDTNR